MARQGEKAPMNVRTKMYLVLLLCCVMLLVSVGIALFLVRGFGSGEQAPKTVDSEPMVVESGYNKDANLIDSAQFDATILPQTDDAGQGYLDETLFLGDSNTARMYRMFDYCSYENAIGSVGMTARSLASFACVKFSDRSGYVTMPDAVGLMQPRRVILTFGTNDLDPGLTAAAFIENYRAGIEAVAAAYPTVDIIVNSIPPLGQQHSNQALTQAQVDEFNKAIVEMCHDKGWKFLNSAEVLKDESTGYAKSGYVESSDGIHLTRAAMDALFTYVRTHSYITDDDRPALQPVPTHVEDKDAVSYSTPVVASSPAQTPAGETPASESQPEETQPEEPQPEETGGESVIAPTEPPAESSSEGTQQPAEPAPEPTPAEPEIPTEPTPPPSDGVIADMEEEPDSGDTQSDPAEVTQTGQQDPTCLEPGYYFYSDGTSLPFGGPLGHLDENGDRICDRCGTSLE